MQFLSKYENSFGQRIFRLDFSNINFLEDVSYVLINFLSLDEGRLRSHVVELNKFFLWYFVESSLFTCFITGESFTFISQ